MTSRPERERRCPAPLQLVEPGHADNSCAETETAQREDDGVIRRASLIPDFNSSQSVFDNRFGTGIKVFSCVKSELNSAKYFICIIIIFEYDIETLYTGFVYDVPDIGAVNFYRGILDFFLLLLVQRRSERWSKSHF